MRPYAIYTDEYISSSKMFIKNIERMGEIVGESRDKKIWYIRWDGSKFPESISKEFIFATDLDTEQEITSLPVKKIKLTYPEIHNMVAEMKVSDKEDLAFQSAVIILYGVTNDTVSKNKIKKATGYFSSTIDFIFHNFHANEIIKEYQWNIEDITHPETGFMALLLCAMAGAGDIVRSDENGKLPEVDEKPISWKDLYRSEYPAKEIELIIQKKDPLVIIKIPLPDTIKLIPEKAESVQKVLNSIFFFDDLKKANKEVAPIKLKIIPPPIKKKKEYPFVPDEKKVIVRPPAVYSNSSPYGIADELWRGK